MPEESTMSDEEKELLLTLSVSMRLVHEKLDRLLDEMRDEAARTQTALNRLTVLKDKVEGLDD